MMHIADNPEALLDYVYEEGDGDERVNIARHVQTCATCSVAVLELQSVRGLLNEWKPPAARLGFKVVPEGDSQTRHDVPVRAWHRPGAGWPAWVQVAAGVCLFAAGVGVSQLHVDYAAGALTVRAGAVPAVATAENTQPAPRVASDVNLPVQPASVPVASPATSASADEVLRRVKVMIDESEARQQRELALRLSDVMNDFNTQRRADLQKVDQNFGQLEGQTGAEVAQQRALLNSLVKVSQGGTR